MTSRGAGSLMRWGLNVHWEGEGTLTPSGCPTSLSVWWPGFDTIEVHVRFVVDKVAVEQDFLRVLTSSPVSIIPPMLHGHIYLVSVLHNLDIQKQNKYIKNEATLLSETFNWNDISTITLHLPLSFALTPKQRSVLGGMRKCNSKTEK